MASCSALVTTEFTWSDTSLRLACLEEVRSGEHEQNLALSRLQTGSEFDSCV